MEIISFLSWWISIFQRNIVTGSCDKDGLITRGTSEVYRSESGCTLVNLLKKKEVYKPYIQRLFSYHIVK